MNNNTHIYDLCKEHMHAYVLAEMQDGTKMDGIVTGIDDDHVYFAVPIDYGNQAGEDRNHQRQYGGYHGYPGYGYQGPGYGYGGYPPRQRFRRVILPLAALTAISLLPWY